MSAATRTRVRKVMSVVADVTVGLVASLTAVYLFGAVAVPLGPVDAELTVRPAWSGSTSIAFVPFGAVTADTPSAPAAWTVEIVEVRGSAVAQTVDALGGRGRLPEIRAEDVATRLGDAARKMALTVTGAAVVSAAVAAAVLRRRLRGAVVAVATAVVVCGGGYLWSAATLDADAFDAPRSRGALAAFERVDGFDPLRPQRLGGRLGEIESEGLRVVRNLVGLYYGFVRPGEGLEARRPEVSERMLVTTGVTATPDSDLACRAVAAQFDVAAVVDTGGTPLPAAPFQRRDGAVVPFVTTGPEPATDGALGITVLADSAVDVGGLTVWGTAAAVAPDAVLASGPAALAVVSDPGVSTASGGSTVEVTPDGRAATIVAPGARFDPTDVDGTRILAIPPASVPGGRGAVCSVVYLDRGTGAVRAVDVVTLNDGTFDVDRRTFAVPAGTGRS